MNLSSAKVVGFFSLPSAELAESNPAAYAAAMADAPAGAGSCAHCGTGILHHVVVDLDGARHFIGTTCALRIGDESVRRCVSVRKTSDELAHQDAEHAAKLESFRCAETARVVAEKVAGEKFADLATRLTDGRGGFCDSIASDLRRGVLPSGRGLSIAVDILAKQAGRRGSKAYDAEWDVIADRLGLYSS